MEVVSGSSLYTAILTFSLLEHMFREFVISLRFLYFLLAIDVSNALDTRNRVAYVKQA